MHLTFLGKYCFLPNSVIIRKSQYGKQSHRRNVCAVDDCLWRHSK